MIYSVKIRIVDIASDPSIAFVEIIIVQLVENDKITVFNNSTIVPLIVLILNGDTVLPHLSCIIYNNIIYFPTYIALLLYFNNKLIINLLYCSLD